MPPTKMLSRAKAVPRRIVCVAETFAGSSRVAAGETRVKHVQLYQRRDATPVLPDLRRLQAFVVLAEELHFRRAAERLFMAQSPLSRMIKGLEHDLGAVLFERTRHSVKLTTAGEALLREACDLLDHAERVARRVRRVALTP